MKTTFIDSKTKTLTTDSRVTIHKPLGKTSIITCLGVKCTVNTQDDEILTALAVALSRTL